MKKLALAFATLLALSACQDNATTSTTTDTATTQTTPAQAPAPKKERKAEHYAVGTVPNTPPFVFKDEYGLEVGFDLDILQAIADDQNFSFDIFADKRANIFNALSENKYQVLAANLAITPERQETYAMSKPYIFVPNVIMGKEGGTVKTLEDLGSHSVAVPENSFTHETLTKAGVQNIVPTVSLYAAYTAFIRGEADYVVGDAGVLSHHHASSGVADTVKVYTSVYDGDEFAYVGYAISKENAALAEKINAGLANIRANGKYDEIYKKWFGDDNSLKVPANRH